MKTLHKLAGEFKKSKFTLAQLRLIYYAIARGQRARILTEEYTSYSSYPYRRKKRTLIQYYYEPYNSWYNLSTRILPRAVKALTSHEILSTINWADVQDLRT